MQNSTAIVFDIRQAWPDSTDPQHPAVGSPRFAFELRLEGLRAWPLRRYPYLVFYVEREDHLDVWRVLHAQRDIPAWMQEPEGL